MDGRQGIGCALVVWPSRSPYPMPIVAEVHGEVSMEHHSPRPSPGGRGRKSDVGGRGGAELRFFRSEAEGGVAWTDELWIPPQVGRISLSLWERVRVRGGWVFSSAGLRFGCPSPRPLSRGEREKGDVGGRGGIEVVSRRGRRRCGSDSRVVNFSTGGRHFPLPLGEG